jgi:pSer/pThr/pTyr-binding forkhead associated (FHA) protein
MNWLELSVSECPTTIRCHVCEQSIDLVLSEAELEDKAAQNLLSAFAVVPCTGTGAPPREPTAGPPSNGAEDEFPPPVMAAPKKAWTVTLQNGEAIKIDKDTMIIGRSRTCDVVIPSAKVSRQHASITRVDGEVFIEDLGSANGVWFNGEKVTRTKVSHGDAFTISDETLLFECK